MQRYRGQLRKETLRIVQRALERQTLLATSKTLAAALPMVAVIAALGPSNPLYYLALLPVMVAVGLWLRAIPRQELVALPFSRALLSGDVAWIRRADDNGLVPSATITIGTRSGQSHCIVIARCDARRAVELLCAMAPWTRVGPPPQPDGRRHQPRIGPRTCGKMVRLAPPPSAFAITLLLGIATGCVVGDGNDPQDSDTTEFAGVTRSVSSKSQFLAALRNAGSGDHIKLARTAVIDLTGESELVIPAGVTISGGRSSKYPGAVLRTREDKGLKYWNLLRTGGPGVTIRDLRLEGPDQTIGKGRSNYATGIRIHHQRTAVEGCAIYGWPGAGVGTKSLDQVVIRENAIYNNIRYGLGYGVVVDSGDGIPIIEYNIFDRNRHSIAGNGYGGYIVRHNTFFAGLFGNSDGMMAQIDMHGVTERTLLNGDDQAGTFIHVYANDFAIPQGSLMPWGVEAPIAGIRGVPSESAVFELNCVARTDGEWVEQSTMTAHSSKQTGQNCYQKAKYRNGEVVREAWLCSTPTHGSAMEGIVLRDNKMGQATGCRGEPFEGAFADDDGHSLEPEIDRLAEMGIVSGCSKFPEPRFCPDQNVTRGQAAAMIVKAFDIPRQGGNYFDDDDGRWFERYADALYRAGVTTGTAPRRFDGYEVATRGTVITFISRALDLPPTSRDYFTDDNGTWWEDHANRARAAGIVNGCSSTRFCGSRIASRAETAAMVVRAID